VYDVDDLTQIAELNFAQREAEASAAEALVIEEVKRFHSARAQRSLGPTIADVRARVHQLKEQELAWAISKSSELTQEQEQLMRRFGDRFANKMLHDIVMGMKGYANQPERAQMLDVISKLFTLDHDPPSGSS
jgi:glutamyl-tRNA reductase